jgi:hypothetical protein
MDQVEDQVEFVYEPDPSGGGLGECLIVHDPFQHLPSADEIDLAALDAYVAKLSEGEPIALEVETLTKADVESIRGLARTHRRAVIVRRSPR